MAYLNSVLIEGTIQSGTECFSESKFVLVSEKLIIDVYVSPKFGSSCKSGRVARVVGRIESFDERAVIQAEHIEFRPQFKKQ